jgi:hypothetical protein
MGLELDPGQYLTERLRAVQPELFDETLERERKRAFVRGILLGLGLATTAFLGLGLAGFLLAPAVADHWLFGAG